MWTASCSPASRSAGNAAVPPLTENAPVPAAAAPDGEFEIELADATLPLDKLDAPPLETPDAVDLTEFPGADLDAIALGPVLPIELHERVIERLTYYTEGAGRSTIEVGLERAGLYAPMIRRILVEEGVPQDLIHLAQAESTFKPEAVSSASARGMWQFIPSRGEEYGLRRNEWIDERSDPEKSTRAAARHLRDLYDQFGNWYLAMAAYNGGPLRVRRALEASSGSDFWTLADERRLPAETRNYVPTILAMALIGREPERYGFQIRAEPALNVERVRVDQATDLRVVAQHLELELDEVQQLNPHVLRWATPPNDEEFSLILPVGYAEPFRERVSPLAENERILFRYHVVTGGETLSYLSRHYEVSMTAITAANRLQDAHTIRIGQSLIIPLSGVTPIDPDIARLGTELAGRTETPPQIYRIRRGDTVSGLADRFGLSGADIRSWNGMSSDRLIAGESLVLRAPPQTVSLPPGTAPAGSPDDEGTETVVYSVRPGDTLTRIALSHSTSVAALREWNPESDLEIIHPGDLITIYLRR